MTFVLKCKISWYILINFLLLPIFTINFLINLFFNFSLLFILKIIIQALSKHFNPTTTHLLQPHSRVTEEGILVFFPPPLAKCGIPLNYLRGFKAECIHCILSDYNLSYQLFKEKVPFCFARLMSARNKSSQVGISLSLIPWIWPWILRMEH